MSASDGIKVCAHDLEPDTLLAALQAYLGTQLAWMDAEKKGPTDLSFSGPVDELLEKAGLRRADGDYA